MNAQIKIVEFDQYCKKCKYWKLSESEDPGWDCLADAVNVYSHKPTKFEEADKK